MDDIERQGGSVKCIENGYYRNEIQRAAYEFQRKVEQGKRVIVGVNKYSSDSLDVPSVLKVDPALEKRQIERVRALRGRRDNGSVKASLEEIRKTAETGANVVEPVIRAVEHYATVGEISDVFRSIWGEYHEVS